MAPIRLLLLSLVLFLLPTASAHAQEGLPLVPTSVREALVTGDYDAALDALDRLEESAPGMADTWQYLRSVALAEAGLPEEAITALESIEREHAASPWLAKARFRRAELLRGLRRYEAAEAIYEAEAKRLLSAERKTELAQIYLGFADELSTPAAAAGPGTAEPDYARAYELYRQSLDLGAPRAARERALYRMGVCQQEQGRWNEAIGDFEIYVREFDPSHEAGLAREQGAGRELYDARLRLGRCRLNAGRTGEARRAFEDLARDLHDRRAGRGLIVEEGRPLDDEAIARMREIEGTAQYLVAKTWGTSRDEAPLAVAALRRFIEGFGEHARADSAAFEIGQVWRHAGRHEDAFAAYTAFLALPEPKFDTGDPRRDTELLEEAARQRQSALFLRGSIRAAQERFGEAIELFNEYVRRHPTGPEWSAAQQAIVETEYAIGVAHRAAREFEAARTAWTRFLESHPLDHRASTILFVFGEMFVEEAAELREDAAEDADPAEAVVALHRRAIAQWRKVVTKYPGTEDASRALLRIGLLLETELGDLEGAVAAYRECNFGSSHGSAVARLSEMTTPRLLLVTERIYRGDETPRVKLQVRNVEEVRLELYRIDLEAYFRKHLTHRRIESLDLDLIAPDETRTIEIADYVAHAPLEQDLELPFDGPGVFAVTVIADELRATTLLVRSDLDIIVKSSRREVFVFAQDMLRGEPAAKVRLLVGLPGVDAAKVVEVDTDEEGIARIDAELLEGLENCGAVAVLALRDGHCASEGLDLNGLGVAGGVARLGYVYTDRPAYRPGNLVSLRAILREVADGRHTFEAGAPYLVEVNDSQGRLVHRAEHALSEFGTVHDEFLLDTFAPVGRWTISCRKPSGENPFSGSFTVERYVLQPVELTFDLEREVYYRGETVEVGVRAGWHYGVPVADSPLRLSLPDGRIASARTDAEGRASFSFDTRGFPSEGTLDFRAELLEEGVSTSGRVFLSLRGYRASLSTARGVYLAGDRFDVNLATTTPDGKPAGRKMNVSVLRRETGNGNRYTEVLAERFELTTDDETGDARHSLLLAKGGNYVLRAEGTDRFDNPILAEWHLFVSGEEDAVKLRLLTETQTLDAGATALVDLHNRAGAGLALVTFEAERVFDYRIVRLEPGRNELRFRVADEHFPNFAVACAMMQGDELFATDTEFTVQRKLVVKIDPAQTVFTPGETAEMGILVTDQRGRPVRTELSLAVVDAALYDRYPDPLPPLGIFFEQGARRVASMRTASSCAFRYQGATTQIDAAVLAEHQLRELTRSLEIRREDLSAGIAMMDLEKAAFGEEQTLAFARDKLSLDWSAPQTSTLAADELYALSALGYGGGGGAGGRFGNRAGERYKDASGVRPSSARAQRAETAFWTPAVVTDEEGRATVTFPLPERSTRWRVLSKGVSANTILGEGESSFVTRAELFVELRHPGVLTEGDDPRFVARVHNLTGRSGQAQLRLTLGAGDDPVTMTGTVTLSGDGVFEHVFTPNLSLAATDALRAEVRASATFEDDQFASTATLDLPVRPWGLEHSVSESGRLTASVPVWLELPDEGSWRSRTLELYVGPGAEPLLVDEALGRVDRVFREGRDGASSIAPTQADAASELFGVCAVLDYLRGTGRLRAVESARLFDRASGLIARLVASQRDDGGWAWSGRNRASDPATSAFALAALGRAQANDLHVPPASRAKAIAFVENAFRQTDQSLDEMKAMLQWALALNDAADFGALNRLHRVRHSLSPAALAYTALALDAGDRAPMAAELAERLDAGELVEVLEERLGVARACWDTERNLAWNRSKLEMTAVALLALQRARPASSRIEPGVAYLLSARPWYPARARGLVLASLAEYFGRTAAHGTLGEVTVSVGGKKIETIDFADDAAGRFFSLAGEDVPPGRTRLDFEVRGNAELFFTATLRGFTPEVKAREVPRRLSIRNHTYLAPGPVYRGQEIQGGFGILRGSHKDWENTVEHLALGSITRARLRFYRTYDNDLSNLADEYLVLDVPLPAGTSLLEGSVHGSFADYEVRDGVVRFHVGRHRGHGDVYYSLVGRVPGEYRVLPAVLRSAYEPSLFAVAEPLALTVLERGVASEDAYRATPSELYHLGKALYDHGERERAHERLLALYDGWEDNLHPQTLKDVASMLLFSSLERGDAQAIVRFFEVLKEKNPDLTIPFEKVLAVGEAYRTLGEFERALLIFRATIEETFGKDLKVAGALSRQGEFLGAIDTLEELWLDFPDLPVVVETYLTVADMLLQKAPRASADEKLRDAGIDQAALEVAGIVLLQRFMSLYPTDPLAPDAGLQLVAAYLEREDHETASTLSGRLAVRHPEPKFADAFLYTQAVADWYLDRNDEAVGRLERIAAAEYTDDSGRVSTSENRNLALYILGQIHHALRHPAQAIAYYEKVAEQFPDAREAIEGFREKRIELEEVTTAQPGERVALDLTYRNIEEAELLVYSVDLMTLYLREKNLSRITAVNLAGIAPALRRTVKLGEGEDLRDMETEVELELTEAGAYLVICRGDELHTSGLVLVSPLELDVREDPGTGHMRIQVVNRETGAYVKGVDVKVIGSEDARFLSGKTDPRGLFVADAVTGTSTVIARLGDDRYAFYRGTRALGAAAPAHRAQSLQFDLDPAQQQLDARGYFQNVLDMNREQQEVRLENFQDNVGRSRKGVQVKQVR